MTSKTLSGIQAAADTDEPDTDEPDCAPSTIADQTVTPTIEGSETFAALEAAIQGAHARVFLAYWSFQPELSLIKESGREETRTWGDLIKQAARRGVDVRVILTDFDPILGMQLHAGAISAYKTLVEMSEQVRDAEGSIQPIVSRHAAVVGWFARLAGIHVTRGRLRALVNELNAMDREQGRDALLERLSVMPGLWPWLKVDGRGVQLRFGVPPVYPGVHHEKLCVIDGRTAFLGGLDIDAERYDTPDHQASTPWHDVACKVDGPVAADLEVHLRQRWNTELARFLGGLAEQTPPTGIDPLPRAPRLEAIPNAPEAVRADQERQHREEPPQIGRATCRAVHTLSGRPWAPWSPVSRPLRTDIAWTIRDTIFSAQRFVYIENQYLRSHRVVDWLLEQARTYRELEIIVVLPLLPEGMFTEDPNRATKQGHHLQATGLRRLRDGLGDRVGIFTLLRNGPAPSDKPQVACLYGSDLVYVHAKVLIADDREALIGSANLNERSLQTDTETGLHWRSPDAVAALRRRLWSHHFDVPEDSWGDGPYLPRWREIAAANVERAPGHRQGFVVPLPDSAIDHQAESSLLVPTKNV